MSQGAGAPRVGPGALQPFGDCVVYGRLRGCDRIIREADQAGRDWLYIDRGYLRASRDTDYSGYFRATWNHLQGDGTGAPNFVRLRALGVKLAQGWYYGKPTPTPNVPWDFEAPAAPRTAARG